MTGWRAFWRVAIAFSMWAREVLALPVQVGMWQEAGFPVESFDAITLFHVVEHLEDPAGALARVCTWLRPAGIAVVEVPNVEAVCGSPRRRFHFAHLYNFNGPALEMLGRKAGLDVLCSEVSPDGGNLTVVFQKPDHPAQPLPAGEIPANCARVLAVLMRHTPWRHGLSWRTWWRPLGKLRRSLREACALRGRPAGRALLDEAILPSTLPMDGERDAEPYK